jgi:two-component system nitrogen regulation response regulator NtrX
MASPDMRVRSEAESGESFLATPPLLFVPEDPGCAMYGVSQAMQRVVGQVHKAAARRSGVLVSGESGTGRGLIARAIHASSTPHAPLVRLDCAGIPTDDLETQLFGVVGAPRSESDGDRGAADRLTRSGLVYQAHGGTLFLENIGEMPSRVQARLCRLLRDKEAEIVDERSYARVDFRPIASVGPSPESLLKDGRLRTDLHEQLAAARIHVPSLRQRREDVPLLVNHFLKQIGRTTGTLPRAVTRAALALLTALPWPGNVRELRGLVERLVLAGSEPDIRLEDVLAHVHLEHSLTLSGSPTTLREARAQFERDYIAAVLQQFHGRMDQAARALGLQRPNLYRKVRRLNLVRRPRGLGHS